MTIMIPRRALAGATLLACALLAGACSPPPQRQPVTGGAEPAPETAEAPARPGAADPASAPVPPQEQWRDYHLLGGSPGPAPTAQAAEADANRAAPWHAADAVVRGLTESAVPEPVALPAAPEREGYDAVDDNPVRLVAEAPVSTFSIDVDTAAYANVRRFLSRGSLPRADAVRTEEIINYFDYAYPQPAAGEAFSVTTELGPSPWHPRRKLLHIGLQGAARAREELPPANLVFLVDVSGSMRSPDKLDLLKASLKLLTAQLRDDDSVAIAVYAGAAGVVLEPTPGRDREVILGALERLHAGGSTNGGDGIRLAYSLASRAFVEGGVNRVILATDGDFNVGTVDHDALEALVETQRERGVALTVLGFGTGNYQDGLMQRLAQIGNGNAAYIDSLNEARKVLVDELASTLEIIARDVKIQVEFNPAVVAEYRLIGYETRALRREDFNNDRVDAGDVGAGHTVTAIYELALVGDGGGLIDPLRYAGAAAADGVDAVGGSRGARELGQVRLRFKRPDAETSVLREYPLYRADVVDDLESTSESYRFGAAAAAFGQLLRGGRYTGAYGYDDVQALAAGARGRDPAGYRGEFLSLVATADALASAHLSRR